MFLQDRNINNNLRDKDIFNKHLILIGLRGILRKKIKEIIGIHGEIDGYGKITETFYAIESSV